MRKFITSGILAVCLLLIGASNSNAQVYTWGITITLPYTSCNTQTISGMPNTSYGGGSWQSTITLQRQVGAGWTNVQTIVTTNGSFANFPNTVTGYYRVASNNAIWNGSSWIPNGSTVYSSGGTFLGPYTVNKSNVLNSINLNGTAVFPTTPINLYNCNAVILNALFSGDNSAARGSQYNLVIRTSTSTGGAGTNRYAPGWSAAGVIPTSFDLAALMSGAGFPFSTNTGYFLVTLEIKNTCNGGVASTKSGLFQMISAPTTAAADFRWVAGSVLTAPNQTLPGTLVGGASLAINGSYSSGYIDWYQLTLQEVNSTTGANIGSPIANSWSTQQSAAPNYSLSNIISQNINSLTTPNGYFISNFSASKVYKLTLTVGNACGQSSQWGYFWSNNQFGRLANPDLIGTDANNGISIYPSPANEQLSIQYNTSLESKVAVNLFDATGRNVLSSNQTATADGTNTMTINVASLPNGIYYCTVTTGSEIHQSKIVITH